MFNTQKIKYDEALQNILYSIFIYKIKSNAFINTSLPYMDKEVSRIYVRYLRMKLKKIGVLAYININLFLKFEYKNKNEMKQAFDISINFKKSTTENKIKYIFNLLRLYQF